MNKAKEGVFKIKNCVLVAAECCLASQKSISKFPVKKEKVNLILCTMLVQLL